MSGVVNEYKCGCMIHSVAGAIRRCSGVPSRTLSGRVVKADGESRHSHAMNEAPVKSYDVANILP